jgi:hypothetical protein
VRVRVSFRYRADTGEVEVFEIEDLAEGPPLADHDARHDAAARDVARVVAPHPIVSEVPPGASTDAGRTPAAGGQTVEPEAPTDRRVRITGDGETDRRVRD